MRARVAYVLTRARNGSGASAGTTDLPRGPLPSRFGPIGEYRKATARPLHALATGGPVGRPTGVAGGVTRYGLRDWIAYVPSRARGGERRLSRHSGRAEGGVPPSGFGPVAGAPVPPRELRSRGKGGWRTGRVGRTALGGEAGPTRHSLPKPYGGRRGLNATSSQPSGTLRWGAGEAPPQSELRDGRGGGGGGAAPPYRHHVRARGSRWTLGTGRAGDRSQDRPESSRARTRY